MKLIDELYVWEVSTYEYKWVDEEAEEYEVSNTIDNTYLTTLDYPPNYPAENEWYEKLIAAAGIPVEDCVVQVYHARTATLFVDKKSEVTIYEADCATGYSGSPVYERIVT